MGNTASDRRRVLRAAIAAEEAAANCRPLMVAMLRGELERRAEAKP